MSSIKVNFIYSSILTTANYIFPFLTYPYISRVLGVSNIGLCNFIDSIINYFILFSMMGISATGIREIAKYKNNTYLRSQAFSNLFILNTITTTIILIILIVSVLAIPKLYEHRDLMFIGAVKLISNYLLIDWLYKGLEEFKYITIRTIIIKSLFVISIFIFIRNIDDYKIYYLLLCLMITINAICNCNYARKFVKFRLKYLAISTIKEYLHPFITLGLYLLLTSMYTSFNVAYLGFVTNETEVGYYTTATKLYSILLALFTAFTGVLLPRMSSLIAENRIDDFKKILSKSINILITFSVPSIILTTMLAPEIITIIAGEGYEGAITPMRIVMPLMLIIGYEQILVIQTLMPLKKDKYILYSSILGAITGILMNILLVSTYKSIGSSIVWVVSEVVVLLTSQYFAYKAIAFKAPLSSLGKNILGYTPLIILIYFIQQTNLHSYSIISFCILITIVYCCLIQICIFKNNLILNIIRRIKF